MKTLDELKKIQKEHQHLIGKSVIRKGDSLEMKIIDVVVLPKELYSVIEIPSRNIFGKEGCEVYAIISGDFPPYFKARVQKIEDAYILSEEFCLAESV